jgi:hypothetical protein
VTHSHKKLSKQAAEQNELLQAVWQAESASSFVWLDKRVLITATTIAHGDGHRLGLHPCVWGHLAKEIDSLCSQLSPTKAS